MRILVLMVSFGLGTSASPVNLVQTRNGSTCLAVILTLLLILSLLIISKQIFMKNRRAPPLISSCSYTLDASLRSSTSLLPLSTGIHHSSGDGKAGILVGLFGSPSWETRTENVEPRFKSGWKVPQNITFKCQLHTGLRHSKISPTHNSRLSKERFVTNVAQLQSFSMRSTAGDNRALYDIRDSTGLGQRKTRSLRLIACPSKTYEGFHNTRATRRLSLPTIHGEYKQTGSTRRKSGSSSQSPRTHHSDVSALSSSANSSLRLVDSDDRLELPLPLSPNHICALTPQALQEVATPRANPSKHLVSPVAALPLPPLPVHVRIPETSPKDFLKPNSPPFRISHPYALTSNNLEKSTGILSRDNKLSRPKAFQISSDCIRPSQLALTPKADCQSPITREHFAQVTSPTNCSPLASQVSSADSNSIYSDLSPYPSFNSSNPPRAKYKQKSPPPRARRSPAIGPSPLRSVILPDSSDANIEIQRTSEGTETTEDPAFDQRNHHTSLGIGSSVTRLPAPRDRIGNPHEAITVAEQGWKNGKHGGAPVQVEDEDANILLDIIRELAEETNDWDASLFMDENFKAMIKGSGFLRSQRGTFANCKSAPVSLSSNRSDEVNLGILGIDSFRSDVEMFIPRNVPGVDAMKVVPWWGNRDGVNPGKRNEVGLAW